MPSLCPTSVVIYSLPASDPDVALATFTAAYGPTFTKSDIFDYCLAGLEAEPTGAVTWEFYRVEKMVFAKKRDPETKKLVVDRSTIVYNPLITLSGIPEAAYRYTLGSRSAIEWIMDRYQVKTDKASGIVNDPNDWSREVNDPRYILDLLARIVTVSLETMKIVDALPPLSIREGEGS